MTATIGAAINAENPWPGLGAFDEDSQRYFNGRRHETAELRRLVLNSPLTVLFGASGLGKTSLVQAGLFPALRRDNILPVYSRLDVRDTAAPLVDQLRHALEGQIRLRHVDAPPYRPGESLWEYLHREGLELWSEQNQLLTPLFVLDQFEEVFTLGRENAAAVARFRIDLADLVENRMPGALTETDRGSEAVAALSLDSQRWRVLISFREDYLPAVEGWKREVQSILRNRLRLLPMSGEQAFEAVHSTAPHLADEAMAAQIVRFVAAAQEDVAVSDAVDDLHVEPALLSLLCHGLNEKRKAAGKSSFDEALLKGAGQSIVSDFYRNAVGDLPDNVQRFIERELITERGFRNSCDIDDARAVHGVSEPQLRLLVDRRVLRIEPQRGTERVELTHDLLTRVVREDRDKQRARARVRQQRRRFAVMGVIGAGLIALLITFYSMYRNADRQRLALEVQKRATDTALRREQETRGALEQASTNLKSALTNANTLAEKERILREFAERETRVALSHRFSNASLNAVKAGDDRVAMLFALRAIDVTRNVDGTVLPAAEDALRQATPAKPLALKRPGHGKPVMHGAFSPDGNRVATLAEDGVRIWDVKTSDQVLEMPGCDSMVISQDWKRMACLPRGMGGSGHIWNLETGKPERPLSTYQVNYRGAFVGTLLFSADATLTAAAGNWRTVFVRDGGDPVEVRGTPVSFSPNSSRLATIDGNKVVLWDVQSGAEAGAADHGTPIAAAAFSPDSKWLITAGGTVVRLWDLKDTASPKDSRDMIVGPGHEHACLAFSPDGKQVVAAARAVYVWDLPSGARRRVQSLDVVPVANGCRFTSDSNRVIVSTKSTEGAILERLISLSEGPAEKIAVAFSSGAQRRLEASGTRASVYDGDERIADLRGATEPLTAAAFSPDRQRLATAERDGMVRLWSVATGTHLKALRGHEPAADRIAYSPDGTLIASADQQGLAKIWHAESGQSIDLKGHHTRILGIAFSPDGKLVATAGYDRFVRVWDARTGEDLTAKSPIQPEHPVFAVAFTPDGKRFAAAGTLTSLWDTRTFMKLGEIKGDAGLPSGLVFSPNGEQLAAASGPGLQLWTRGGDWIGLPDSARSSAGQGSVGIAFSHDGSRIAGAGNDNTVRLWNSASIKDYRSLYGHAEFARAVAFTPNKEQLVAIADDWSVYRHPLKLDALIAEARGRAEQAELRDSDCEKYLREKRCPALVK